MPQLDLSWFLFNFILAWSLILIIINLFINQNWFSNSEENTENNNNIEQKNNEWTW